MISLLHRHNLTHPIMALAVMVPFALAGLHWIGAALVIGFYWGRETRDAEISARMDHTALDDHGPLWGLRYVWPGHWAAANHKDFWPVAAVAMLVSLIP